MRKSKRGDLGIAVVAVLSLQACAKSTTQTAGKQLVIYMQCGGTQGDGATLARTNGARARRPQQTT